MLTLRRDQRDLMEAANSTSTKMLEENLKMKKLQLARMIADDICNSYLSTEPNNKDEVIRALESSGYNREDLAICLPLAIEFCLDRGRPHVVYSSSTTNSLSIFTRPCLDDPSEHASDTKAVRAHQFNILKAAGESEREIILISLTRGLVVESESGA
jgi:hypothetical protein